MRERKYVKFRVDMYEDTKFKIIDRMPERDLVHYVWNRFVILAGKVNREGDLYMSKNIPYTVETLAIEFNRDIEEIKTALDVFIELEMVELINNKIYRVKNFPKHQNIKVKEKIEAENKQTEVVNKENYINDTDVQKQNNICDVEKEDGINDVENKANKEKSEEVPSDIQHNNSPVVLELKRPQKTNKKNKKGSERKIRSDIIESNEDDFMENVDNIGIMDNMEEDICAWSTEETLNLKEGERLLAEWKC